MKRTVSLKPLTMAPKRSLASRSCFEAIGQLRALALQTGLAVVELLSPRAQLGLLAIDALLFLAQDLGALGGSTVATVDSFRQGLQSATAFGKDSGIVFGDAFDTLLLFLQALLQLAQSLLPFGQLTLTLQRRQAALIERIAHLHHFQLLLRQAVRHAGQRVEGGLYIVQDAIRVQEEPKIGAWSRRVPRIPWYLRLR
ncbi:MAG: hypothetical protein QM805_23630 [Pseudomonas sp.]